MASTVPAKSNNPLHNFDLPHLKWKKNHHHSTTNNNHNQRRRSSSSSAADSSPSPSPSKSPIPPHSIRSPIPGDDSSVIEDQRHKNNNNDKVLEIEDTGKKESRSKILLKLPRKNNNNEESQEENNKCVDEHQDKGKSVIAAAAADEESVEMMAKTWNLRPRKPIHKSLNVNGVVQFRSTEGKPQSPHRNANKAEAAESNAAEKKEKRQRFSISLSREEIEEDIFSMTGLKAARRPKKRVKAVQKQLDNLFPGLWLASVTADSYKVSENHPKS